MKRLSFDLHFLQNPFMSGLMKEQLDSSICSAFNQFSYGILTEVCDGLNEKHPSQAV